MKSTTALLLLSLATCTLAANARHAARRQQANLPAWVDCTSNKDCAPGYCCSIAYEKYSYPRCQELREVGDFCRPGGPLVTNGTRSYPDLVEIELGDVYLMLCPCATGLTCDRATAECRDAAESNLLGDNAD